LRGQQVDIFEDEIKVFIYFSSFRDAPVCVGTYYCYENAYEELINNLSEGLCAWMTFNGRKTESRRLQKYQSGGPSSVETLG
jgi:hypothetical protein